MSVTGNKQTEQVKEAKALAHVNITRSGLAGFVLLQSLLLAACGYFTYHFYVGPSLLANKITEKSVGIAAQQQQVTQLKQDTQAQLAVLAQRMGTLTARMNRMDALGERLAKTADYSEFDFSQLPAVGGPEQFHKISEDSELAALFSQMDAFLDHLDTQQEQLDLLEVVMLNHEIDDDSRIQGKPIKRGWMSSMYGMRNDPFNGRLTMHKGVDYAGKDGDAIFATGAGVVSWAGERSGYGLLVEIDHGAGLKTRYGHAKSVAVNIGDVVAKGEIVAEMGNTGRSTGAHVHYEVLNRDKQVNPRKYIYR
ncbi:M23 family metallopeptidase [Psychrobium sp. 1_MG-2023]|uniref:M23 family metallopeptidase n=1 Tax=Psychrobium sp. 1_MG-2023 TaxID=3062624 RepID=UPI000C3436B2|nr:M23 family metallopeptidase [Psychrobium sp. 1_MG-2023]MDP2561470.1 M23 family metallopeptidase [Psychrobium sp. 1_MG-2023]PKF57737.1 hypothetical protein CW748_05955 [Alteromonadales bacterium alter-6D02]